jgi:RES domain-containing protein
LKTGHNLIAAVQEIELFDSCGLGVRVIRHKYRSDSLGATGALKAGGRYNIPEGLPSAFGALYVAGDIETAEIEASSIVAFDRWEKSYFMAMYKLLIADLRQSDHLSEIDFTADELSCDWRLMNKIEKTVAPTQGLALMFHQHTAAQGLIYPSNRNPTGHNLVIFPEKIAPGYYLKSRFFFYSPEEIGQDISNPL